MPLPLRASWDELSPELDVLLELDERERSQRLDQLRAEGRADLANDLERLLQASLRAEDARFLAGEGPAGVVPFPSLVGSQIGGYVIEASLGGGANGSVWKARPIGSVDGTGCVAIKLLHLSLVGQPAALRFRREAVMLARVRHPSIAEFLGMASTPEGQPYLLLELVDGAPIDEYCDRHGLTITQRLELFVQLLEAVAHAHSHHVIHRDLKPSNVLVTPAGCVKLLDFGIAKLTANSDARGTVTATGTPVLTPQYAAPEQFRGDTPVPATDVFALGVLLFKMVAAVHPFLPDVADRQAMPARPFARSAPSLRKAIRGIGDREQRISLAHARGASSMREWLQEIDPDLERTVAIALGREPGERFPDAAVFLEQLRGHLVRPRAVKLRLIDRITNYAISRRSWFSRK